MDARTMEETFARTLVGDYDDDAPWRAVHALRLEGTRPVFDFAAGWCRSEDPLMRARGADVLAQLGKTADHHGHRFPEESFAVVSEVLREETAPQPLTSAIYALGHIGNFLAIALVLEHRLSPNPDVGLAVACALGNFADSARAVEGLIALTRDVDEDVRDWATFGLGVLGNRDSPEVRDALFAALSDSNEDVHEEAMIGLAKRKDPRVLTSLLSALEGPEAAERMIEAVIEMLGMQAERKDWQGRDYAVALRQRFHSSLG